MSADTDFLVLLKEKMPVFTRGQRNIARYIIANYHKVPYMTAEKLAKESKVSTSSVNRFVHMMGYDNYQLMSDAIGEYVEKKIDVVNKVSKNYNYDSEIVSDYILGGEIDNIKLSLTKINIDMLEEATKCIISARRVFIIGVQSGCGHAMNMALALEKLNFLVVPIIGLGMMETFEKIANIMTRDVVIAISTSSNSMRILKVLEYANNNNAKIITITDSGNSVLSLYSACNFVGGCREDLFFDMFVSGLAIVNVIVASVANRYKEQVKDYCDEIENIKEEYMDDYFCEDIYRDKIREFS